MKALYRKWSGTAVIRLVTALTLFMFTSLALNSCCRHHKLSYEDDEQAISLSVTSAGTKAVVGDLAGMVSQCFTGNNPDGGFGVYGYKKQVDQTSIKLFNNIRVYPNNKITQENSSTTWSYTPTRYWDSNPVVSYQFIAYWPYISPETQSGTYVSVPDLDQQTNDYIDDNKKLIIHNVPNWQRVGDNEVDYLTAAAWGKYRTSVPNEAAVFNTGTVPFSFRHILSQLVIKAYYIGNNQETGDGVTVNSITLSRSADDLVLSNTLDGNTVKVTDFSQKYDESNATPQEPVSPKTNMAESCTLTLTQNGVKIPHKDEISNVFTLGNQQPTAPVEIGRWLMVPHKWQALMLSANRTIAGSAGDTDPVPVTIGESHFLYVTQPGTTYTITLMFDVSTGGITVGSIDIQDWTEQKTTHEVYNW